MAEYTPYKSLELPIILEHYNIAVFNKNNTIIDSELHKLDLKNQGYDKNLLDIQAQLDLKAPLANPVLTGVPKAPTATAGTNTPQIATTNFVQTAVSNHNTSTSAHSDIRDLISTLTTRLNTLADSDDTTLDQLSEIVAYIKSNRSLVENITTNKVNVADIIDNLTSTATNKPLSANQGRILKGLIDSLTKNDIDLGNVENKSSATIRGELTKENVTNALGYTPPTTNTTYGVVSTTENGLCPKRTDTTTKFLRDDGTWAVPENCITYSDSEPNGLKNGATWVGN